MPKIVNIPLTTRRARLLLPVRGKPYTARVASGIRIGYRRNRTAGAWSVLCSTGEGGTWLKRFAWADDFEDADGKTILDYWQACEAAKRLAREDDDAEPGARPATVEEAIQAYKRDLAARGQNEVNATSLFPKLKLVPGMASKPVSKFSTRDLLDFRDSLIATGRIKRATTNRYMTSLLAALRFAAKTDKRITNAADWKIDSLQSDSEPRNVILSTEQAHAVVDAAHALDKAFGLLIAVLAETGTRISQARRLIVEDLVGDTLMVPPSRKGRGKRYASKRPVSISRRLSAKLRVASAGRASNALLLVDGAGEAWRVGCQAVPFREAAERAGLDPDVVTTYALRHTSIVRHLLDNVPVRLVAALHDTSIAQIEKCYSRYISDVGDHLARAVKREWEDPTDNVVHIRPR
jgi:integrase